MPPANIRLRGRGEAVADVSGMRAETVAESGEREYSKRLRNSRLQCDAVPDSF